MLQKSQNECHQSVGRVVPLLEKGLALSPSCFLFGHHDICIIGSLIVVPLCKVQSCLTPDWCLSHCSEVQFGCKDKYLFLQWVCLLPCLIKISVVLISY